VSIDRTSEAAVTYRDPPAPPREELALSGAAIRKALVEAG
jgi:hypothetical protein